LAPRAALPAGWRPRFEQFCNQAEITIGHPQDMAASIDDNALDPNEPPGFPKAKDVGGASPD